MTEAQISDGYSYPARRFEWVKRLFDLLVCIPLLILSAPLLLFIAILIRLDSPGNTLFRQQRHGRDHVIFNMYKFRSMTQASSDNDTLEQVSKNDSRVTRIGKLLRRTSLDELPQILNVLKGDMSLIGPRPHALDHNKYYEQHIPTYRLRHSVRPGITGLAQVQGFRGATPEIQDMANRVEADLKYLENWTFWGDIKILLWTALVVFEVEER